MSQIVAEHVVRRHPSGRGIAGISLSVRTGECFGVAGENGSGKTTLTRLVAGLERADGGSMSVLGRPAFPRPAHLRHRCGVSLDTPAHWDGLSGRQNLWFFARQYGLSGRSLRRRVDELLSGAELAEQADDPVATYSFGMRRKLSVIEALAHDPDLLILDEPSAGADGAFLDWLAGHIHGRCERGKTTWVADNDTGWLASVATETVRLRDGRIKAGDCVPKMSAPAEAQNRIDVPLAGRVDAVGGRP